MTKCLKAFGASRMRRNGERHYMALGTLELFKPKVHLYRVSNGSISGARSCLTTSTRYIQNALLALTSTLANLLSPLAPLPQRLIMSIIVHCAKDTPGFGRTSSVILVSRAEPNEDVHRRGARPAGRAREDQTRRAHR